MQSKRIIWLCAGVFGWIGGYIPLLWGGGAFSFAGIILSGVGAMMGIYIGYRVTR